MPKRTKIAYKIETGSDGNLILFSIFTKLFPRSTIAELNAGVNRSIVLKTYNQSNIEQLSRCSVQVRHNNKCVNCGFFVVTGDGPALFRMPDIELFSIIRVMCDTIDNKTTNMKLNA